MPETPEMPSSAPAGWADPLAGPVPSLADQVEVSVSVAEERSRVELEGQVMVLLHDPTSGGSHVGRRPAFTPSDEAQGELRLLLDGVAASRSSRWRTPSPVTAEWLLFDPWTPRAPLDSPALSAAALERGPLPVTPPAEVVVYVAPGWVGVQRSASVTWHRDPGDRVRSWCVREASGRYGFSALAAVRRFRMR